MQNILTARLKYEPYSRFALKFDLISMIGEHLATLSRIRFRVVDRLCQISSKMFILKHSYTGNVLEWALKTFVIASLA